MRLLLVSLGTLIICGLALVMTRFWGLGQVYQEFEHPFFEGSKPWTVVQVTDLKQAEKLQSQRKDVIFWLNLNLTEDQKFIITNPSNPLPLSEETLKQNYIGPKTFYYKYALLKDRFGEQLLLEDFLKRFPQSRIILVIRDNANNIHTSIIKLIEEYKASDRVLFQSDIEIVLQSIKKEKPLWVFGTSYSDLMRLLSFESVWLLPASPFYGDAFISEFKLLNRPAFNTNILEEMRRRHKNIMLGPLRSAAEIKSAKALQPDAYIYETPELFELELDQNLAQ